LPPKAKQDIHPAIKWFSNHFIKKQYYPFLALCYPNRQYKHLSKRIFFAMQVENYEKYRSFLLASPKLLTIMVFGV